jgi:type II secretory pathway pseudopilin PulG
LINPKTLPRTQSGFTYIGLLILIAIMGVTLAGIGTIWRTTQQRFREQQLLFVGNQFSRAITAYYLNSPGGVQQFPKKLEDLLIDKRYPNTRRYLRKIFADPMTGNYQWGLIKAADGGIVGVRSLSDLKPVKSDNFGKGNEAFANRKHYSEWQFTYRANLFAPAMAGGAPIKPAPATNGPSALPIPQPPPPPPNATTDPAKQKMCKNMFSIDINTCSLLAKKFDQSVVDACMASADQRYAVCMSAENAELPSLTVQYE